jgi:hypothetical protein
MAGFKYERFVGQFPARSKRLLAANAAVVARDMRLGNGEILPLLDATFEYSFTRATTPPEAFAVELANPGATLVDTRVVSSSFLDVVSPEITSADWVSATTPASNALAGGAGSYDLENSSGGIYAVERMAEPGSLVWDRSAPLVLEMRLDPWARVYENIAESYAGAGAKQFFFRGARPLGDGVVSRVEALIEYLPDVADEMVITVRFKHWVEYPHDGVYPSAASDVWVHTAANSIVDIVVAEIRSPTNLAANLAITLQLVPDDKGDVTLFAYNGSTLVGEYLDRSGRPISIPAALFPRYFDVYLRAQGVDVHTNENNQIFGFTASSATPSAAPAPAGYVAPFNLPERAVDGAGSTRQYPLDAFFAPYNIPAADGIAAGWDRYLPFSNALNEPVDWGVLGAFRFGEGVSDALKSPVYLWESAITFQQKQTGVEVGDIHFDNGVLQDPATGILTYTSLQEWTNAVDPYTTVFMVASGVARQGDSWLLAGGAIDWSFATTVTTVIRRDDAGGGTVVGNYGLVSRGLPTAPVALAAWPTGENYLLVYRSVHGVNTNNIVAQGAALDDTHAFSKAGTLCNLRAAMTLPSATWPGGGFVIGGVEVIAFQTGGIGDHGEISFTLATTPAGVTVNGFCSHGGLAYAACDDGKVLVSNAGLTAWTTVTTGFSADLRSIASNGTLLVAVGNGRTIIVSADAGATWVAAAAVGTIPAVGSGELSSVAFGDGMWVAAGNDEDDNFYGTSSPLGEWFRKPSIPGLAATSPSRAIAYANTTSGPAFAMTGDSSLQGGVYYGVGETLYPGAVFMDTRTPIVMQWKVEDYGTAAEKSAIQKATFRIEGANDDVNGSFVTAWAELAIEVKDDMPDLELEVSLSRFRETPEGVIINVTEVLGRVVAWTPEDDIIATIVVGGRLPSSPVALTPGDLIVDVNGVGASVGWLSGVTEAASSPAPNVPQYLSPSVKIQETLATASFAPVTAITPRLSFLSEPDEIVAFAAHGGSVANILSLEQALDENSRLLVPSNSGVVGARTIQRLSRLVPDTEDEIEDFWIRILQDADFVGEMQQSDIYGRLYWVSEGEGARVDTLDQVYFNASNLSLNVQQGFPVGVPSGEELVKTVSLARTTPAAEQYEITHAGLLKIPAFTANILEGNKVIPARADLGGQAVLAVPRAVSYPETYYLLLRTSTADARAPLGPVHVPVLQFQNTLNVDTIPLADGPTRWVNAAADSQEKAFHFYPRDEANTTASSAGLKLLDADTDFAGFPAGTFLAQSIRSTIAHPVDPGFSLFGGTLAATEYLNSAGTGLETVLNFYRNATDTSVPSNWRFVADRVGSATKSEALLPGAFNPILLTDPEKVFSGLFSRLITKRRLNVQTAGGGKATVDSTFVETATVYATPLNEEFLNALWVFQVDAATFASLKTGGIVELLAGTHFTQAKPKKRWVGEESLAVRTLFGSKRYKPAGVTFGVEYPRGISRMQGARQELDAELVGDEWTTGPLLIDPAESIDWSFAALTTTAYLEFDPVFDAPALFDPLAEPLSDVEFAFVPVNIYGEEGPPRLESTQRYTAYPLAPLTLAMTFSESLIREYRVESVNIYRLEEDGVYYFLRNIPLPEGGAPYSADVVLGRTVDMSRPLVSLNFDRPPQSAIAAIRMNNGSVLLASGRELLPSEPGYPHAYPRQYKLELDFDVVGFGSFGDTVVACTTGQPYLVGGDSAGALRTEKLDLDQACVSRGSIVSMSGQVIYASREGLFSVGRGGIKNLTAGIADTAAWAELNPETFHAHNWDGKYLCFFSGEREEQAFMLDPEQLEQGLTFYNQSASAGFSEIDEPGFYFLSNGVVYEWDSADDRKVWTWGSRFTRRTRDGNPGRLKVQCSQYPVTFSLWVDNKHHVCKEWTILDDTAVALPSGLLGEEYYLRLKGVGDLITVEFGDTIYDIQKG